MTENRKKLVELKNVSLTFNEGKKNEVKAINNVSFDIYEGEVFGLVGESGSGKTTVGRAILKLYDINGGEIDFDGETVSNLKGKELHEFRKNVQMIFQDPQASLNGRMKIRDIVAEGLDIHKLVNSKEERDENATFMILQDEIDNSFKSVFRTNWKLNRNSITFKTFFHHFYNIIKICSHNVHFINVSHSGDTILIGLTPNSFGLRFNTAFCAKNSY